MTQPHRGPPIPKAAIKPDPVMEPLLKEAFTDFKAEFSYAVDEVSVLVSRDLIVSACNLAKTDSRLQLNYLRCLAVTEYHDYFQVSYMLYSIPLKHKMIMKVNAPKSDPVVPSVTGVWTGANWHEREGAELFGVKFSDHPDPKFLLLFEEFEGKFPMRKDYPFEEISEWTPQTAVWQEQP
ncbi:MAG: nuoC [Dehalococcoidia bacterium]|nr:nuoC [Dehalococcoidia bacterium]